jgi:hypothetical protein
MEIISPTPANSTLQVLSSTSFHYLSDDPLSSPQCDMHLASRKEARISIVWRRRAHLKICQLKTHFEAIHRKEVTDDYRVGS